MNKYLSVVLLNHKAKQELYDFEGFTYLFQMLMRINFKNQTLANILGFFISFGILTSNEIREDTQ